MTREAKKQINALKPEIAPVTKSTAGYNYYLSPRTTSNLLSKDKPINSTGEVDMKTKFNLSTTNKGTKLKLI